MAFLNPQEVVKLLPLKEGMVIADFGCGAGYFSLAIAKAVKPTGKVIALDIWQPSLDALNFRAKVEGLANIIETKWANLEKERGSGLNNDSCDLVLIANILFEIEQKNVLIKEAKRILKNGGYLTLIEWHPDKLPSKEMLFPISKEEAMGLVEQEGFKIERDLPLELTHYGFLAKIEKE
ncbi:MAG TPA: class I SAM-dependent methyltransferase [Candidatus Paceibacterota bacterium]|jgi:ubiquinone/menaquinone biosynthesis C-methylase UbiE|nr:class I SAM-dependent methyltransferase [Candidatus Paceibacterota bacterium]HPQ23038.1 class I SAM-dependent methyltransferase [Candidatus Paceibacterota bacterium]